MQEGSSLAKTFLSLQMFVRGEPPLRALKAHASSQSVGEEEDPMELSGRTEAIFEGFMEGNVGKFGTSFLHPQSLGHRLCGPSQQA